MAILVNGREYEWGDISMTIGGVSITGFRGIKYGGKQEKEALHAKGNKPQSVQFGNINYEGALILTQSAAAALDDASGGELMNIRGVNILIQYGDPSKGVPATYVTLIGCSFSENAKDWKQGTKFIEINLPFLYLDQQ